MNCIHFATFNADHGECSQRDKSNSTLHFSPAILSKRVVVF